MAKNEVTIDVEMRMVVPEKAVERCFQLLEMWLADNPDKTIVIEQEVDLRVCLIAEEKQGKEETLAGPWINCNDRLPSRSGYYLCWKEETKFINAGCCVAQFSSDKGCFYSYEAQSKIPFLTHWMELPEGPTEE